MTAITTRADVARRAGVSPAVVSYVLNGGSRPVAARTRERVLRAIEELGYRPNAAAQVLRGASTRSIGLLSAEYWNPFYMEVARAIEALVFADDHVMIMGSTSHDAVRANRYLKTFVDRKVDGVIVLDYATYQQLDEQLRATVPIVVLEPVPDDAPVSSVTCDERSGAHAGVRHLTQLGHREIAAVVGPEDARISENRLAGWADALREAGISPSSQLIVNAPLTREGGQQAARAILATLNRPSAVFISSDAQAVGFLAELSVAGVSVPRDLALVSFDGTEQARYSAPPLSSVEQPLDLMAHRALERLQHLIGDRSSEPTHDVLDCRLALRASSGTAR